VRKKAFITLFTVLLFLASLLSVTIVRADVPSVLQINVVDSKIIVEIRHSSPSASHFVETVEVRIGDNVYEKDLDPQSEVVFEIDILFDDLDLTYFEVRTKCITHGWSNWTSYGVEEPTEDVEGIPGFPVLSVLAGVMLLMLLQKTCIPTHD
jgi:hypothetical protein